MAQQCVGSGVSESKGTDNDSITDESPHMPQAAPAVDVTSAAVADGITPCGTHAISCASPPFPTPSEFVTALTQLPFSVACDTAITDARNGIFGRL